eukprot:TRINITY_DN51571_c0_g1_i1.p1 TRINITY_DN51571_c0_g1~~TRINITY_DN51571_c0_g1_i1.p1  ORF type:complete len:431 (-),score=117.37 TRINITY_DN51571_c0_g1_i1:187-1479(-)
MLRSLVGSEMCIRDSINAEYGELRSTVLMAASTPVGENASGDLSWLDDDLLAELGVDSSDLSGFRREKKAAIQGTIRRLRSNENFEEMWMALEQDLKDIEDKWRTRFLSSAVEEDPRLKYVLHCTRKSGLPSRVNGEMKCCQMQLAGGAFGAVHTARSKSTNQLMAIKAIRVDSTEFDPKMFQHLSREVFAGFNLMHPCLVKVHEFFLWQSQIHLVLDLVETCDPAKSRCPDLFTYLTVFNDCRPLTEIEAALVVFQASAALLHLEAQLGAIHRDMKPENILVGAGGLREIKVADYGAVRLCYKQSTLQRALTKAVGSEAYRAAEVRSGKYDGKADVYSLGCTMYVCGKVEHYCEGQGNVRVSGWGPGANHLLGRMIRYLPLERCSMREVFDDGWLNEVMEAEDAGLWADVRDATALPTARGTHGGGGGS